MLAWIGRLFGGVSLTWWLVGALTLAAAGYVATTQVVLHNRQAALEEAVDARQQLAATNATLTGQLDQVQRLNADNLRVLAEIQADHARGMADVQAQLARAQKSARGVTVVMQENARDPDANRLLADACPVLDRLLDRLSDPAGGAAAQGGDQDRAGAGRPPRRPADLPAGTADPVGAAHGPEGQ